jgi:hypothetical protein
MGLDVVLEEAASWNRTFVLARISLGRLMRSNLLSMLLVTVETPQLHPNSQRLRAGQTNLLWLNMR